MPLLFGLATIAAAPTVEAVTIDKVDIINGFVDVDENAVINPADDLSDVALWCNEAAPFKVDIIDGGFDVNEGGGINLNDDLVNCDLNDEQGGFPTSNQVDIINGLVDVDENTVADDSKTNIIRAAAHLSCVDMHTRILGSGVYNLFIFSYGASTSCFMIEVAVYGQVGNIRRRRASQATSAPDRSGRWAGGCPGPHSPHSPCLTP
jgi:hypothetical protein